MFFTYPIEATNDNWVSECLKEEILACVRRLDAGEELPAFLHGTRVDYRAEISRFTGIGARFRALIEVAAQLSAGERGILMEAIETQNQIPAILDGVSACVKCERSLPEAHDRAKELYKFCFERLSSIKSPGSDIAIRDAQYQIISRSAPTGCCPFCGMGRLETYHPDIPREDLDHYMAITQYPFAGVNLMNLSPMCRRCNSSYKGSMDIMYQDDGVRAACIFPYGEETIKLEVSDSQLFGGAEGEVDWVVELEPDTPEARNWDRVFQIRMRYRETVLKNEYKGWLTQIGEYVCRSGYDLTSRGEVIAGLESFRRICAYDSLIGIGLVKGAMVDLLIDKLRDENVSERLYSFLRNAWSI